MRLAVASLFIGSLAGLSAYGQSVISAHSGVVHYVEGKVTIDNKVVELKFGQFPELKPDQVLRTESGRAEILLSPGSFLRVAENSAVRMVSNHLTDTRLELVQGEALVESMDGTKDAGHVKGNVVTVAYKDTTTMIDKPGLYQFSADPARLRVYEGEALVKSDAGQLTLKKGKETVLGAALMAEKFDTKVGDDLTRWSARRSGYLAMANVSAARSMSSTDNLWNSYTGGYNGGWAFNPMFGQYTFMPMGSMAFSPFGYGYFSPYSMGLYDPMFLSGFYPGFFPGYYPGYYGGGGFAGPAVNQGRNIGNYGGNSALVSSVASHNGGIRTPTAAGYGVSQMARTAVSTRASSFSSGGRGGLSSGSPSAGSSSRSGGVSGGGMSAGGGRGGHR